MIRLCTALVLVLLSAQSAWALTLDAEKQQPLVYPAYVVGCDTSLVKEANPFVDDYIYYKFLIGDCYVSDKWDGPTLGSNFAPLPEQYFTVLAKYYPVGRGAYETIMVPFLRKDGSTVTQTIKIVSLCDKDPWRHPDAQCTLNEFDGGKYAPYRLHQKAPLPLSRGAAPSVLAHMLVNTKKPAPFLYGPEVDQIFYPGGDKYGGVEVPV